MQDNEIHIASLAGLDEAAGAFLEAVGDARLVAFYAPMGVLPLNYACDWRIIGESNPSRLRDREAS